MQKWFAVIFLTSSFIQSQAHQDFSEVQKFDNVQVRFSTGFQYHEKDRAFYIGQLALSLCKDLHFYDPVFIDFRHQYINPDLATSIKIGVDSVLIGYEPAKKIYHSEKPIFDKPALTVTLKGYAFNSKEVLTALIWAINNKEKIRKNQKTNFENEVKSIPFEFSPEIKKAYLNTVDKYLQTPIFDTIDSYRSIILSFKNDTCQLSIQNKVVLIKHRLFTIDKYPNGIFIYEANNVFRFINLTNSSNSLTNQFTINDLFDNEYQPFHFVPIGSNDYARSYNTSIDFKSEEMVFINRTIVFSGDKLELVQNIWGDFK